MNEFARMLPDGLTPDTLLVALVGSMAFFTVLAVWYALIERDPMARRVKMLAGRRAELRGEALKDHRPKRRSNESLGLMRRVVKAVAMIQSQQSDRLNDRLAQAGLRSRDAVIVFLFFKLAAPIAFGAAGFVAIYLIQIVEMPPPMRIVAVMAGIALGFFIPDLYVSNRTTKRQRALAKALPDALDLLVICAESGLSLDSALDRVANEIGGASTELAEELSLTSIELGFLPDRRQALQNLNRRTDLPAIRGVVNTLLQTEKYGTPLSQSLRVLSTEFRDQRMLRAEEKAARLPATMTVPMIVFILPTLFIVLIGPAILRVMDNLIR